MSEVFYQILGAQIGFLIGLIIVALYFKLKDMRDDAYENDRTQEYWEDVALNQGTRYTTYIDEYGLERIKTIQYSPAAQVIIDKREQEKLHLKSWNISRGFA